MLRVGACADELCPMVLERVRWAAPVGGGGCGGSVARKAARAAVPPRVDLMCSGPCGQGSNCTLHGVLGGGFLPPRRAARFCTLALVVASRAEVGTLTSRLRMEVMENPMLCCSRAYARVQSSGSQWTRNSSTKVCLRPCLTLRGSQRASTRWMEALSPGASLPRSGSTVVEVFRLRLNLLLSAFRILGDGMWTTRRWPWWRGACGMSCAAMSAPAIGGWPVCLARVRGAGLSGRRN